MFVKITPKPGVLTLETIERELELQSTTYLGILKNLGSKEEFKNRTVAKIEELEEMLVTMKEENNLEMVTNIEEAIKNHKGHLETMEMTYTQYEVDKGDVEDMVLYLNELKDGIGK